MERRNALKIGIGTLAGTGIGLFTIANAFKNKNIPIEKPNKLEYERSEGNSLYVTLNPETTAELAYEHYSNGACMYAIISSFVSQLAEKVGEPYASLPIQMFKYGHGGVGGYGTLCGAANGAAALIGLFITDKNVQDSIIADVFQWYEKEPLPEFKPTNPKSELNLPSVPSNSVLCHASNTNWCNESGYDINSNERKERCRRLTADVAKKLTIVLNELFNDTYITNTSNNVEKNTCLACHGKEGKIKNSAVKMECNSCHSESFRHKVFSDVHYKLMTEQ
jgi:hypothetical protein